MQIRFDGQRALVTGAGKGIGRAIACHLANCGAVVIAVSRTAADLRSLHDVIGCETIVADLADAKATHTAAVQAGEIDLLVNNAGISIPQPFLETSIEAFDATIAVNVRALLVVSQVVASGMIRRGRPGAIVNLSSQASLAGLLDHAAYGASKGAVDALTRVMAQELGPHGIRVNAFNPTVTLTPMGEMAWSDPGKSGPMLAKIPLGHFARRVDVADAVAYLLSEHAAMIHGVALPVDGGYLSA
jgi:NAD(P)-dependent dehydrogenase (short-subunit alcohol dehydrogenase family)